MTERLWEVPSSWEWTVIKELGDVVSGATPSTKVRDYWDGDVIWFAPSDLTGYKQKFIARGAKTLTEEGLANSSARIMPAGSVMFSSRAPVGYVAITSVPAATNQGFKSVVPYTGIFNEYLYHYLKASKQLAEQRATGTTFKELSGAAFGVLPAPLPPTNEQRRIVEKIEAMFDEIDKGVESLQTARAALGLYRQSLLKSAFEGRLTAYWRAQNADKLEAPETLLARIQTERDTRYKTALDDWQTALTKWRADAEQGKKPAKPKRPKDLKSEPHDRFAIPSSWITAPLGAVAFEAVLGKMLDRQKNRGKPRPYLGNINLRWGAFDVDAEKTMLIEDHEVPRYGIRAGDLVICEGGEPGRCAVWQGADESVFIQKALHRVRFTQSFSAWFAYYFLRFATFAGLLDKHYTGSTIKHLTGKALDEVLLPICSPAEQTEIVRILDEKLEAADALDAEIDAALTRADALRQSILKKAFSGQLVPQDPKDEPASILLERIKVEKAEREQAAKRNRKSTSSRKLKARRPTLTDLIAVLKKQKSWISASKAAQALGIGDNSTSDDVEAFYRQLKDYVERAAIEVERRGDEDWLRLTKAKVS
ncbi:restriction endonuclease subunit S [Hyphococcus sp. DH-69]|uniref:restriction endonuclease subunit S n=1 Tax=Hyphococcus formosus TaxID=3143534 RepID=UPI00398B1BE9